MTWLEQWLATKADALRARDLTRTLRVRETDDAIVDLAGNDYLGLAHDPRVIDAAVAATRTWGTGATASRLVSGTTRLHADLERALANQMGMPAALVFSSGYLANLGIVSALGGPDCLIVTDAHVHASLVDATRLARSPVVEVPHNDCDAVADALARRTQPRAVVLTESVFSVLGDAAPLHDLSKVCAEGGAVLVVDEAHGLGVVGSGHGAVHEAGLAGEPHVVATATLSKALASQGGAIVGSQALVDHLVNRARSFIFDTALAPGAAGAALAALGIVRSEARYEAVLTRIAQFASVCGVATPAGAVLSVPMSSARDALDAAATCLKAGIRVAAFRPPSVPDGVSRLRITARATLSDAEVARACEVLATVCGPA